ncbi:MAG: hypothetical protein M1484_01400 [Patescibacteria group bacterium]|nr:hypothetical protein [Patescibacteria group bacterium]MCL5431737.1 hypothetical protein [Patescibacteria group bacterium]
MIKKKIVIIAIILLAVAGIIFWQRERIWPQHTMKAAVSQGDVTGALVGQLEAVGFVPQQAPLVLGDAVIATVSGIKVYFSRDKDFATQVRSLQLLLSRRTIEAMPAEIDLRFTKAVLRF